MRAFHASLFAFLTGCATEVSPPLDVDLANAEATDEAGRLVVDLADGTPLDDARAATGLPLEWVHPNSADEALAVVEVDDLDDAQHELEGLAMVEAVEPSLAFEALGYPNDPMYQKQWNFRKVGAPTGWKAGGGNGVVVAVIDTGVTQVADLEQTEVLEGVSFVPGTKTAADDNGHGTHVAGTIAQSTHNGFGVAGIAPRAAILPLKALTGSGMGRSEWIASAIDEAVDQGAQVINLSLGGPDSRVIRVAAEKAVKAGVVVVAAAGNTGRRGVGSPANIPGIIGVSATGPSDELAPYSSWGKGVDISAPGGDKRVSGGGILQDTGDLGKGGDDHAFRELQGTSMATPHVAGAAAILWSAGATSADDVKASLYEGAVDLGEPGPDLKYGQGRLDIAASLGEVTTERNGLLFAIGALGAWLLASMGGLKPRARVWLAALAGGAAAGGLFFLPLLPLAPSTLLDVLARPMLLWSAALIGTKMGTLPLFISAAVPIGATLVLGPTRSLGPIVAGVSAGIAAHLLYGAAMGSLTAWPLGGTWNTVWLVGNGTIALLCAMATVGVQKMRAREES